MLKVGDRIRMINMPDDPNPIPPGEMGVVYRIAPFPEWTQVYVSWDSGRSLMLSIPPDVVEVVAGSLPGQTPTAILNMTPIGRYADGSPRYLFSTSFPSQGVRQVGGVHATPEAARAEGQAVLRAYERQDVHGNMGEVCGVVAVSGGYRAVINTYHSNT
jgi:hypothetical protein